MDEHISDVDAASYERRTNLLVDLFSHGMTQTYVEGCVSVENDVVTTKIDFIVTKTYVVTICYCICMFV